jgi:Flp pilus assembly protein TadG
MERPALFSHPSSRKPGYQNAQGMVEFALIMPLLLLMVYGILEVGRLLFTYSTVITASREAVRYGSATGLVNGKPQYMDCAGIKAAAQRVDFLGAIDDANITISYATTASNPPSFNITITDCNGASIPIVASGGAIKVKVTADFVPLFGFVPLISWTNSHGNPLSSTSQRTILGKVNIIGAGVVAPPPAVTNPPVISKSFAHAIITLAQTSTLTFPITNPKTPPFIEVAFNATFSSGAQVAIKHCDL